MKRALEKPLMPSDPRASIAVDLGAESCRVSLLRWLDGTSLHRARPSLPQQPPRARRRPLHWDLNAIVDGVEDGLRKCAALAPEGIRSIAVDGWAVDYVRIDAAGTPLADPFCYRDQRTVEAESVGPSKSAASACASSPASRSCRSTPCISSTPIPSPACPTGKQWLNLPEYLLSHWGGTRVAEYTNATHTQLVELYQTQWCRGDLHRARPRPRLRVPARPARHRAWQARRPARRNFPRFSDTTLIAPACHDTAAAIAGIPATGNDWAYISSGTWSLVGTLIEQPRNGPEAAAENFTNLGAVGVPARHSLSEW